MPSMEPSCKSNYLSSSNKYIHRNEFGNIELWMGHTPSLAMFKAEDRSLGNLVDLHVKSSRLKSLLTYIVNTLKGMDSTEFPLNC